MNDDINDKVIGRIRKIILKSIIISNHNNHNNNDNDNDNTMKK